MSHSIRADGERSPRRSYGYLLLLLVLFMALLPFLKSVAILRWILEFLLFLALLVGVWSTRAGRPVMASIAVLGGGILVDSFIDWGTMSSAMLAARSGLSAAALFIVTASIVKDVLGGGAVNANRVMGSACIYLLFGIIWSSLYTTVEALSPGSFSISGGAADEMRYDLWYFSMVTLTTLGYGDIAPLSPVAKSLAVVEAVTGQLILVILVARTVGLHTSLFPGKKG